MKNSYSILILGANTMQLPAIRIAKEKGWRVFVADRNSAAPGAVLADKFVPVDLKDKSGMLAVARELEKEHGLDGIFTAGTDFSSTVAYVAENMDLPGIPYEVALKATDKSRMRNAFLEHNVPSPRYVEISSLDQLPDAAELAYPLVIKPVDNMGARGVRCIRRPEELPDAFRKAINASRSSRVIVEEFLEGQEFSIDALVFENRIEICGIADRHIYFPPYFVEMGHTMPSDMDAKNLNWIVEVFKAGVKALGINWGAAKGDVFLTEDGPKIGEIAARLSGGYMSGWTYPLSSGFRVTEAALELAVGIIPEIPLEKEPYHSAERAVISIPGVVRDITGTEQAAAFEGIRELFMLCKAGGRVTFPTNNVEKCGNIISRGDTRAQAVKAAEEGVKEIVIRLAPDNTETEEFLFSPPFINHKTIMFPPPAYRVAANEVFQVYQLMPPYRGNPLDAEKMALLTLPGIEELSVRDWHQMDLSESLQKIALVTQMEFQSEDNHSTLFIGKIFWEALFRGGYQGGLYILDTINSLWNNKKKLKSRLEEWAGIL